MARGVAADVAAVEGVVDHLDAELVHFVPRRLVWCEMIAVAFAVSFVDEMIAVAIVRRVCEAR